MLLCVLTKGNEVAAQKPAKQKDIVKEPTAPEATIYTYVEQMPEYTPGGGMQSILNSFWKHFNASAQEVNSGTAGRVHIEFVVSETGAITSPRITRSGGSLDAAALRAVRTMPAMRPGKQSGVPVKVRMTIPIACVKPQ
jgi:TonB family protein